MERDPGVSFSVDELGTLSNALNEVMNGQGAIEDWEFQTRLGVTKEFAQGLLDKIRQHLDRHERGIKK